jgi:pimeloyl-ACP methyl ester carboxylesterase
MNLRVVIFVVVWIALPNRSIAQTREVRYQNGPITLVADLTVPPEGGNGQCIVVIHGSGDSDRRNMWARAVADVIASTRSVVVLPDKRGSGKSGGAWRTATFDDLARDAIAAIDLLQKEKLECRSFGLAGLSQGGRVAPLAATLDARVAFIINVSGSAVPAEEQLLHEITNDFRNAGLNPEAVEQLLGLVRAGIDYIRTGQGWGIYSLRRAELSAGPLASAVKGFPADPDDWFWGFWRNTIDFDPMPFWRKLRVPAVVFYGAEDESDNVPVKKSVGHLKTLDRTNMAVHVIPGVGHSIMNSSHRLEPAFVEALTAWLRSYAQTGPSNSTESALLAFATAHFAAFGNSAAFEQFYDQSAHFTDVEQGRIKDWLSHRSDIRGFFARATSFKAGWTQPPRLLQLSADAALIVGYARFEFTLDGIARESGSTVTYVVRRVDGAWKIVHAHGSATPPATLY